MRSVTSIGGFAARMAMVLVAAQTLVLGGCGGKVETISLAGESLPKTLPEVAIGNQTKVGPFDSQTATYSGATMGDFNKSLTQMEKAGWKVVSRTETVSGLAGVVAKDKSRGTVSWSPSSGLIVNIQVPRAAGNAPAGEGAPAQP